MNHDRFLDTANAEARDGLQCGHGLPFGAVIAKHGVFVVSAHNERVKRNDPTAHSEILAIRKARRLLGPNLRGCVLYTTCEPCQMCVHACWTSQIDTVVYQETVGQFGSAVKRVKQLRLSGSSSDEEMEITWNKSILRQVESDEKHMWNIVAQRKRYERENEENLENDEKSQKRLRHSSSASVLINNFRKFSFIHFKRFSLS